MDTKEIKDEKSREQVEAVLKMFKEFGVDMEIVKFVDGANALHLFLKTKTPVRMKTVRGFEEDLRYLLGIAYMERPRRLIDIPTDGRPAIEITIPKQYHRKTIAWKDIVKVPEFTENPAPLAVPLGASELGGVIVEDIARMPHLLVAGSTGSGKSSALHSIINSLAIKNTPNELQFLFVDPRIIELGMYDELPHLIHPSISDPRKGIQALHWLNKETERRYGVLETNRCRDIASYYENVYLPASQRKKETVAEPMPYIVPIIDEVADLMTVYPREFEANVVRLAQMSRAVGIHLILSTQRPSCNVVTGLIKANIPARMAFKVASQIDSRTILDQAGAERLLGEGDMLYLKEYPLEPSRGQVPYIFEEEIQKHVQELMEKYKDFKDPHDYRTSIEEFFENGSLYSSIFEDEEGEDDEVDE